MRQEGQLCGSREGPGSEKRTHLLVEDEVVGVAVRLLERELRDVVVLHLLDGLLETVEGRVERLGLLRAK